MRVLVAGSRWVHSQKLVAFALEQSGFSVTTLLSGGRNNADMLAERWATQRGIPLSFYRNPDELVQSAEAGVIIRINNSPSASALLEQLQQAGKPVRLIDIDAHYSKSTQTWTPLSVTII